LVRAGGRELEAPVTVGGREEKKGAKPPLAVAPEFGSCAAFAGAAAVYGEMRLR
jgi:hypothetical protein